MQAILTVSTIAAPSTAGASIPSLDGGLGTDMPARANAAAVPSNDWLAAGIPAILSILHSMSLV